MICGGEHPENLNQHTCDYKCIAARKKRCECRCGGVNHGYLHREEKDQPINLDHVPEVARMLRGLRCPYCNRELQGEVTGRPHPGGSYVNAMKMRLWITVRCGSCRQEVSYLKAAAGLDLKPEEAGGEGYECVAV
jgi:hypothetical protein